MMILLLDTSKSFHNRIVLSRLSNSYFSVIKQKLYATVTSPPPPRVPPIQDNVFTNDKIDLLYDSECPICQMEVDFLKKRDINNRIKFTDLSSPDYKPSEHGNVKFVDGMRKIRAVLPDKRVVTGVEVFRQTYQAIGLGWIFALTNLPVIGEAADMLYDVWAENRLRITG